MFRHPVPGFSTPLRVFARLASLAALLLAACGTPIDLPECGPDNCSGCCDGTICMDGNLREACGAGGEACSTCDSGERCSRNACVEAVAPCNAQTCPDGCCAGRECLPGTANAACGTGGRACSSCGDELECREGGCAEPIKPPCDPSTCNGCCVEGVCVDGFADDACGSGGIACETCFEGESCDGGRCYEADSECGLTSCDGCCSAGVCLAGTDESACGAVGSACRSCAVGTMCNENGRCVTDVRPCGPDTCDGCCLEGVCVSGKVVGACGVGGDACEVCAAGQHCSESGCGWGLPSCGPWNCNGCCADGVCLAGKSADACGLDAAACSVCDDGSVCRDGACAQPLPPCTGDNCDGCCLDGVCVTGDVAAACGRSGVSCDSCGTGDACVGGTCVEDVSNSPCGPLNCAGCCIGDTCAYGSDASACGSNGTLCVACGAGRECRDGLCAPAVTGCSEASCAGCCDDGICRPGTTALACGNGGGSCRTCRVDQICLNGSCSGAATDCGPGTCDGCCRDGVCLDGRSLNGCGIAGAECAGCADGLACVAGSCVAPTEKADWTVLVYMSADGPLDAFAMADLREMADLGQNARLHVIALVDRGPSHATEELPRVGVWSGAKMLHLHGGGGDELADLGQVDMGDPRVLRRFIADAIAAHPSRHTALVLWNHGAAWDGFGLDASSNDFLSMSELRHGIAAGLAEARLPKFDVIGFDASLMSTVEVIHQLRGQSDFLVASEELVPGHGWEYRDLFLATISATGAFSPLDFSRRVVDGFAQHALAKGTAGQATMTALHMDSARELVTATDELGRALERSILTANSWREVARGVAQSHRFGYAPRNGGMQVDLGDLASAVSVVDGAAFEAGGVLSALSSSVVHTFTGDRAYLGGVSVYLPTESASLAVRYTDTDFGALGGWMSFVQRHLGFAALDDQPVTVADVYVESDPLGATLTGRVPMAHLFDLTELSLVYGKYDADHWNVALYALMPAPLSFGSDLHARWDHRLPFLTNGTKTTPAPLFGIPGPAGDASGFAATQFEYQSPHGDAWLPVTLLVAIEPDRTAGTVLRAWSIRDHGSAELALAEGGKLRPVVPLVDGELRLRWVVLEDEAQTLVVTNAPLTLELRRVEGGDYVFGVATRDLAGNWSMQTADVAVPGFGAVGVGGPCPGGNTDCASGHCLYDTWSGEPECTDSCEVHSDCPAGSSTYCGSVTYGDQTFGVCERVRPVTSECPLGHAQCESGACATDEFGHRECVPSCISDASCNPGESDTWCRDLGGGVKGCVWVAPID